MKFLFYSVVTLSLLYIGEFLTAFLFQIALLTLFIKIKYIEYLLYIPVSFLALIQIFAAQEYFLYFVNLTVTFYYIVSYKLFLSLKEGFIAFLYLCTLTLIYINLDDYIYELYLYLNLTYMKNYIAIEVVFVLTLLHLFIFVYWTNKIKGTRFFNYLNTLK